MRAGTPIRPAACELCGAVPKCVLAHHVTYSRPLDVAWLCPSCHLRAHPRPPRAPKPGSARSRAERELRRDPARSDALIAQAACCSAQAAGRWRRGLVKAGVIEAVEPARRASVTRAWPARAPRLAIEAGATTTAEVMALSGASYGAAWRALSRARRRLPVADVAAATDAISVVKTTPRIAYRKVTDRPTSAFYLPPDASHDLPCCTAEWTPAGWTHDRACPMRQAAPGR